MSRRSPALSTCPSGRLPGPCSPQPRRADKTVLKSAIGCAPSVHHGCAPAQLRHGEGPRLRSTGSNLRGDDLPGALRGAKASRRPSFGSASRFALQASTWSTWANDSAVGRTYLSLVRNPGAKRELTRSASHASRVSFQNRVATTTPTTMYKLGSKASFPSSPTTNNETHQKPQQGGSGGGGGVEQERSRTKI